MKEIREISGSTSGVALYDNWLTFEESNHVVWAFEYDGSAVLWGNVKQGDNHFPRKLTMWLDDISSKATSYLFDISNRINEEVKQLSTGVHLFPTNIYIEALSDIALSADSPSWWEHYSSILFLNDNYGGGEVIFEDLNIKVTPKMGSLLFYPGHYKVRTEAVRGMAYRMLSKHTDQYEFKESDEDFRKKPFLFQNMPSSKSQTKKSKGCGCSGGGKKSKIEVRDKKTGELLKIVEMDNEEFLRKSDRAKYKGKKIII